VVDPLDVDLDEMSAADMAKVYRRLVDLSAALEPELVQKAQAAQVEASSGEPAETDSPGLRRLQDLQLDHLARGSTDSPAQYEKSGDDADQSGVSPPNVFEQQFGQRVDHS
jgi:hypothetical protein